MNYRLMKLEEVGKLEAKVEMNKKELEKSRTAKLWFTYMDMISV